MKTKNMLIAIVVLALVSGCAQLSQNLRGSSDSNSSGSSGSSSSSAEENSESEIQPSQEVASLDSNIAENFVRDSFYENTGILTIVECPDDMSGVEGESFTCYACPQDYAAAETGGGYFYGDGSTEFRCDAAYEGFAIDYRVIDGQILLDNGTTRGANE
jgi:hypothetical protein